MDNKNGWVRHLRTAVSLILVGLYVLGLIAMMTFSFQAGLILWVVSTLGGIGLLYWIRTTEKQQEAIRKAEEGEAPEPKDADADRPEGEEAGE